MQSESSKARVSSFDYMLGGLWEGCSGDVAVWSEARGRQTKITPKDLATVPLYLASVLGKNLHLKLKGAMRLRSPLENYPLLVDPLKLFHQLYLSSCDRSFRLSYRVGFFFTREELFPL